VFSNNRCEEQLTRSSNNRLLCVALKISYTIDSPWRIFAIPKAKESLRGTKLQRLQNGSPVLNMFLQALSSKKLSSSAAYEEA
jgi:hypothetical protein